MSTPQAIVNILHWQKDHEGDVAYSENGGYRLAYKTSEDLLKAKDCSSMAICMYKHFGGAAMVKLLKNATYTGNLCKIGHLITTNRSNAAAGHDMLPGDLIFFTWRGHNSAYDHVAIYAGNGRIWNHGGPGRGPLNWSLSSNVWAASEVRVMRLMQPSASSPPTSHPTPGGQNLPFPYKDDVIGRRDNPSNRVHGGIDSRERLYVSLVQGWLHKYLWISAAAIAQDGHGVFGPHTEDAVKNCQRHNGLKPTGLVGEPLWNMLRSGHVKTNH